MRLPVLEDLAEVDGRRTLVRCDMNVPMGPAGAPGWSCSTTTLRPGEGVNDPAFVECLVREHGRLRRRRLRLCPLGPRLGGRPPTRLPSAAGRLLVREVDALSRLLGSPRRRFVAVLGGAKVADKLGVISALLGQVDTC